MSRRQIFFLHNPKAGGTSLLSVFRKLIDNGSVAPVFSNAPNAHRAEVNLSRYKGFDLYAGHFGFDAYRELRTQHLLFTNFRDPVRRVSSIYNFWRNNVCLNDIAESHPGDVRTVELAQKLSFSEFIRTENPDLKLYISNFHFRQLYNSGWNEQPLNGRANWVVRRRIARMPWFYVAETPELSTDLLQRLMPEAGPIRIPRENKTAADFEEMDLADVELLTRLNIRDYAIYAFALAVQEARARRHAANSDVSGERLFGVAQSRNYR